MSYVGNNKLKVRALLKKYIMSTIFLFRNFSFDKYCEMVQVVIEVMLHIT